MNRQKALNLEINLFSTLQYGSTLLELVNKSANMHPYAQKKKNTKKKKKHCIHFFKVYCTFLIGSILTWQKHEQKATNLIKFTIPWRCLGSLEKKISRSTPPRTFCTTKWKSNNGWKRPLRPSKLNNCHNTKRTSPWLNLYTLATICTPYDIYPLLSLPVFLVRVEHDPRLSRRHRTTYSQQNKGPNRKACRADIKTK